MGEKRPEGSRTRVSALPGGRLIQGVTQGAPGAPDIPARLRVDGILGFLLL